MKARTFGERKSKRKRGQVQRYGGGIDIMYRSLGRNLTNDEIDVLQDQIRAQIPQRLGLKLR